MDPERQASGRQAPGTFPNEMEKRLAELELELENEKKKNTTLSNLLEKRDAEMRELLLSYRRTEAEQEEEIYDIYRYLEERQQELETVKRHLTNEMNAFVEREKDSRPEISVSDINTLSGLNWLNDKIIDCYMQMIVERAGHNAGQFPSVYAFSTFFYPNLMKKGFESVRRWTKRINIFTYDILLIPVHLGNHWCLAAINLKEKMITYYDSIIKDGRVRPHFLNNTTALPLFLGLSEWSRLLPRGGTQGQERFAPGHLTLGESYRKRHPSAVQRVRLWNVHLQICRVHLEEGQIHLQSERHAVLQEEDGL